MNYARLKELYQAGAVTVEKTEDGFILTRSRYDRDTGEVLATFTEELSYAGLEEQIVRTNANLTAMNQLKNLLDTM